MKAYEEAVSGSGMEGLVRVPLEPSPAMMQALAMAESLGATNPRLFGGAIRDHILGIEPKDYDVVCDLWDVVDRGAFLRQSFAKTAQSFFRGKFHDATGDATLPLIAEAIEKKLEDAGITHYIRTRLGLKDGRYSIQYKIEDNGLPIDLCLGAEKGKNIVPPADAPINSAVLNKQGECFADAQFEDHIARKLHKPYPGRFDPVRYESLKAKVPDLKHEPSKVRSYDI